MEPLLKGLLITNVVVFCLQLLTRITAGGWMDDLFAVRASDVMDGRAYQLLTYSWLHGNVWHLIFNMVGLYFFGKEMLRTLGKNSFLFLYMLGGLSGGLLWVLFNINSSAPMVGASGAVLALVAAFATLYPRSEVYILPIPIPIQARWMAIGYAVVSILQLLSEPHAQIAHLAHLGGMLAGWSYVKLMGFSHEPMFSDIKMPSIPSFKLPSKTAPPPVPKPTMRVKGGSDFISKEVDPILDKISKEGFQSLTPREKKILEEARKKL